MKYPCRAFVHRHFLHKYLFCLDIFCINMICGQEVYFELDMENYLSSLRDFLYFKWDPASQGKSLQIDVDSISIQHESVGLVSNWRQSEMLCYLGITQTGNKNPWCFVSTKFHNIVCCSLWAFCEVTFKIQGKSLLNKQAWWVSTSQWYLGYN